MRQAIDDVSRGPTTQSRRGADRAVDLRRLQGVVGGLAGAFAAGVPPVLRAERVQHDAALSANTHASMWREALGLVAQPQPLPNDAAARFRALASALSDPLALLAERAVGTALPGDAPVAVLREYAAWRRGVLLRDAAELGRADSAAPAPDLATTL